MDDNAAIGTFTPSSAYVQPFTFENAADVTGIAFHVDGEPVPDGVPLLLTVQFSVHQLPDGRAWRIWGHEASVRLIRGNQRLHLGDFRGHLAQSLTPPHAPKSQPSSLTFARRFSSAELASIEQWRDGHDLGVHVQVTGVGKRAGDGEDLTWSYFREFEQTIPRSKWIDTMTAARRFEEVHLTVTPGTDHRVERALEYLRTGTKAAARTDYPEVGQACRKALEEIDVAGFGRKAPKEVRDFFHHQDPKLYTLEERAAIVRLAAKLYLHSAAHAGDDERAWRAPDADLALALTAAILRVAPQRLPRGEPAAVTDYRAGS